MSRAESRREHANAGGHHTLHGKASAPSSALQPAGSTDKKNTGRLAMRYLLTFHSDAVGQIRCLDTARLPAFRSGRPGDLPHALDDSPDLTLQWMLGRRRFGPFMPQADTGHEGGERIGVYALDPEASIIGDGNDYYGAWLDMFMCRNQPIGWITAYRPESGLAGLTARADHPFGASNETCQGTMNRIRDHRHRQPRETAEPVRLIERP